MVSAFLDSPLWFYLVLWQLREDTVAWHEPGLNLRDNIYTEWYIAQIASNVLAL